MSRHPRITILALETSADETSAAILSGNRKTNRFRLVSSLVASQINLHRKTGGIVPEVAARAHLPKILPLVKLALRQAHVSLQKINYVAVTTGPGLITSLMIGVDTAKALAFALNKPIIPINHLEGHLLSALGRKEAKSQKSKIKTLFPAIGLIVSGGHTLLVLVKNIGRYKILGETLDDAAGECFDKVAKILGLPYPGGPALSKLAQKGNLQAFDFPRPMISQENYDFSFAGLKTHVLYLWHNLTKRIKNHKSKIKGLKSDIAACTEQAIVDVLVAKTIRAAKQYKVKTILLGGGVAANQRLRQTLAQKIKNDLPTSHFLTPSASLTTDNAGMIAITAFFHAVFDNTITYDKVGANPSWQLKNWR